MGKIIISIVGFHASESLDSIFGRKIEDVNKIGQTFWCIDSREARPDKVNEFCREGEVNVFFVSGSTKSAAKDTKTKTVHNFYSIDKINWTNVPDGISEITGRNNALIMDKLEIKENLTIDLNKYAEYKKNKPLKIILGSLKK